jgi:hypothetical protein
VQFSRGCDDHVTVFWDINLYNAVDIYHISKEFAASIFTTKEFSTMNMNAAHFGGNIYRHLQ